MGHYQRWADEDVKLILDNPQLSEWDLAAKLGRTRKAIHHQRVRMELTKRRTRSTRVKSDPADFDQRPSGWYEEVIGSLLIECKDAFDTWKHYHRYVEVVYDGEAREHLGSWVTLQCRRDADAE